MRRINDRKAPIFLNPFFLWAHRSHTSISESTDFSKSVSKILQVNEKAAVVIDIDNTLYFATGYQPANPAVRRSGYGSDIWFERQVKKINPHALDFNKLYFLLLAEYFMLQPYIHQITTEDCVPDVLTTLKNRHIPVIALTARSARLSAITHRQLTTLKIPLTHHASSPISLNLPEKTEEPDAIFQHGIAFCSGRSKKMCLDALFNTSAGKHLFSEVKTVFFMDDKLKYCEEVSSVLKERGFSAIVEHYTHVEKNIPIATEAEMAADAACLRLAREKGMF